ncbi:odorant receptor 131-2-like [Micropterus salmoides]|uniref:odorant receptor 131-2-like n=1 Tax=Micropterus salmoides TaxID=27706 RepID=UPI0018EB1F61|nr:odorant receptor 131-2-like [Micropterus salmoides]
MSDASQANITVALGLLERVMLSTLTTVPCCIFLFINVIMLFTLRSKPVFCETSRYILLYNLLFADTVQMAMSQLLYILSICRIILTYPVCGLLVMFANLTNEISPLTLVVMSVERYVAVCYPLRHAAIITVRNTWVAVVVVWTFCSLNIFIRVVLLLDFPFADLESLLMKDICSTLVMFLGKRSADYDKAYTCFLFVLAGVAIISSYIGVMIAARSASTDKASVRKARNTLLLHLVQLGLSLSSTVHNSFIVVLAKLLTGVIFVRIRIVLYVCFFLLPRCLSALIYGLRDQTIRPVLVYHLCCRRKLSSQSRLNSHPKKHEMN